MRLLSLSSGPLGYLQTALLQACDRQSAFWPQGLVVGHVGAHAGGWHWPVAEQTWDPQSRLVPHAAKSLQIGAHPGCWQVTWHFIDAQSGLSPHGCPSTQSGEQAGLWHLPFEHTRELQS
jgi:hypothetical protein